MSDPQVPACRHLAQILVFAASGLIGRSSLRYLSPRPRHAYNQAVHHTVLLALLACVSALAEDKLVTLDVSAFDAQGKPVTNLQSDEFQLSIDGRPRTVVFSRFDGQKP